MRFICPWIYAKINCPRFVCGIKNVNNLKQVQFLSLRVIRGQDCNCEIILFGELKLNLGKSYEGTNCCEIRRLRKEVVKVRAGVLFHLK